MPISPSVTGDLGKSGYIDKRKPLEFANIPLLVITLVLALLGLLVVRSAIVGSNEYSFPHQVFGVALSFVAMVALWAFDYRKLSGLAIPLLVVAVILILSPHLPIIGRTHSSATSWVSIFGMQLQPGELAKLVTVVAMAALVSRYRGAFYSGREYLKVVGIGLIPFACIMTQPDLGSGLVLLVILGSILIAGGANRKWLLITLAVVVVGIAVMLMLDPILDSWRGADVFIKDYQMNRLLVFIDPSVDPTGVGYNLQQAKIAVGSGGLLGKGLGNGTQSVLGFLPEAPTDFIFCVLAEELGFVGAVFLLALYGGLFVCALRVAHRSTDLFGSLIAFGILGMWSFQVLENIGMTIGLMPITGIPLPFVSYGTSSMLLNFMAVGLLLSIWRFRKKAL